MSDQVDDVVFKRVVAEELPEVLALSHDFDDPLFHHVHLREINVTLAHALETLVQVPGHLVQPVLLQIVVDADQLLVEDHEGSRLA